MPACVAFNTSGDRLAVGGLYGHVDLISIPSGHSLELYAPPLPQMPELHSVSLQKMDVVLSLIFLDLKNELVSGSTNGTINTFVLDDRGSSSRSALKSSVHVDGMVRALALSNDELVAMGTDEALKSVRIWRVVDQKILLDRVDCAMQVNIPTFALSEHGNVAATSCANLDLTKFKYELWSLPSVQPLPMPKLLEGARIDSPTAINSDGTVLAMTDGNQGLMILDRKSGLAPLLMEQSTVRPVESIQAIGKTHELAICTRTQTAIWKNDGTTSVKTLYSNSGPYALSPTGKWMAYFDDKFKLHVLNRKDGLELSNPVVQDNAAEFSKHNAGFYNFRISVSDEGPTIFWMEGGGFTGYAKVWKFGDRSEHILCDTVNKGELVVSPLSTYVAIGCNRGPQRYESSQVLLFRVKDMQLVDETYGDLKNGIPSLLNGLAFTPDEGSYLIATGGNIQVRNIRSKSPDRIIQSDFTSGNFNASSPAKMYVGPIAVSQDGKFIATQVAKLTLSNMAMSEELEILDASGDAIANTSLQTLAKSAQFVSNSLAVGLQDGTTTLYSVPTLKPRITLVHPGGWVAVAPNGLFDGNAEALRWIGWRRVDQRAIVPLDLLYDNYYRPDLVNDIINDKFVPRPNSLSDQLGLGSLEFMMSQGYAYLQPSQDGINLCFASPPQGLELYSDGAPLSFSASQINPGPSASCPWAVKIGDKQTKIESGENFSPKAGHCPAPARPTSQSRKIQGTLHVLTIAVGTYSQRSKYPDLPSATISGQRIEEFFGKQARGPGHLFRDIVIEPGLRDGKISPTIGNIRSSWERMAKSLHSDDTVVLFLSGHGLVPPGTEMFYFAPVEFDPSSLSSIRDTGLNVAMLSDMLRAIPARRILIVLDACQSGAALTSLAKVADVKTRTDKNRDRSQPSGISILASATALQTATARTDKEIGFVAESIIESGSPRDTKLKERISAGQVLEQVCTSISNRTSQTPLTYSYGDNFDLIETNR